MNGMARITLCFLKIGPLPGEPSRANSDPVSLTRPRLFFLLFTHTQWCIRSALRPLASPIDVFQGNISAKDKGALLLGARPDPRVTLGAAGGARLLGP